MKKSLVLALAVMTANTFAVIAQEPMHTVTSDSVQIHLHPLGRGITGEHPVVLAFHQAGSNARGEYGPVVGRLNREGFDLVAVDMRSGDTRFGFDNETVNRRGYSTGYCEALPDIAGSVEMIRASFPDNALFLWGSSFSAALVLRFAATYPDGISGVLAFSPASGEPMNGCLPEEVSDRIETPVLALRPIQEMEYESVATQAEVLQEQGHAFFVSDPGSHGASMLVDERAGGDTGSTWEHILKFMRDALQ